MASDEQIGFLPELLVGIDSIDAEHRRLFQLLHQLVINPDRATTSERFSEIITHISVAVADHFRTEERFIKSCGMPEAEVKAHFDAHAAILEQLVDLHLSMMSGANPDYESTIRNVTAWIVAHVNSYDQRFRHFS